MMQQINQALVAPNYLYGCFFGKWNNFFASFITEKGEINKLIFKILLCKF